MRGRYELDKSLADYMLKAVQGKTTEVVVEVLVHRASGYIWNSEKSSSSVGSSRPSSRLVPRTLTEEFLVSMAGTQALNW